MNKYLFLFLLFIPVLSFTQFRITGANNNVSIALTKVLQDFPNHFNVIRGAIISQDVQAVNYTSTVNITGTDSSIIIQNGNDSDNIYSWRAVVFNTEILMKQEKSIMNIFQRLRALQ